MLIDARFLCELLEGIRWNTGKPTVSQIRRISQGDAALCARFPLLLGSLGTPSSGTFPSWIWFRCRNHQLPIHCIFQEYGRDRLALYFKNKHLLNPLAEQ